MPRLVLGLFLADLLMGALAIAAFAVSELFGVGKINLLRLGEESNLPTWFSASQLLLIGLALSALALRDVRLSRPTSLLLLSAPLLFFVLSLDEVAMLHERVGWLLRDATGVGADLATGPWMFVAVPVFLGALAASAWATRPYWRGRPRVYALFGIGAACFVFSAAGLEFAGNFVAAEGLTAGEGSAAQKALGFGEEVGEMIAATFFLWGALEVLRAEGIRLAMGPRQD